MRNRTKPVHLLIPLFALVLVACSGLSPATPTPALEPPSIADTGIVVEGRLVPRETVELAFDNSGEVTEVLVSEGDLVQAGDVLARLGDREPIESSLANARLELASAQLELLDAEDALKQLQDNLPEDRTAALAALTAAREALRTEEREYRALETPASEADINEAFASLVLARDVLERAQKDYDPYEKKAEDNVARAAALNRLADAQRKYDNALRRYNGMTGGSNEFDLNQGAAELEIAQARLEQAQEKVDLLADGPDPDQVALIQARIETAHSRIAAAETAIVASEAALKDLELLATIHGTVVTLDLIPGQRVNPGVAVLRLADFSQWYIETDNLTEIDVVRISNGQSATVTPDALPELQIPATVERIGDLFEEKRGDVTYTTRLLLAESDPRLRWGMTVVVTFK